MKSAVFFIFYLGLCASKTAYAMMRSPQDKSPYLSTTQTPQTKVRTKKLNTLDSIANTILKILQKPRREAQDVPYMLAFKKSLLELCPEARTDIQKFFHHMWVFFRKKVPLEKINQKDILMEMIQKLHYHLKETLQKRQTTKITIESPFPLFFIEHIRRVLKEMNPKDLPLMKNVLDQKKIDLVTNEEFLSAFSSREHEKYIVPLMRSIIHVLSDKNFLRKRIAYFRTRLTEPALRDAMIEMEIERKPHANILKEMFLEKMLNYLQKKIEKRCAPMVLKDYKEKGYAWFKHQWKEKGCAQQWNSSPQDKDVRNDAHIIKDFRALPTLEHLQVILLEASREKESDIKNTAHELIEMIPDQAEYMESLKNRMVDVMHRSCELREKLKSFDENILDFSIEDEKRMLNDSLYDVEYEAGMLINELNTYKNIIKKRISKEALEEYEKKKLTDTSLVNAEITSWKSSEEPHGSKSAKNVHLIDSILPVINEILTREYKKSTDVYLLLITIKNKLLRKCPESQKEIRETFSHIGDFFLKDTRLTEKDFSKNPPDKKDDFESLLKPSHTTPFIANEQKNLMMEVDILGKLLKKRALLNTQDAKDFVITSPIPLFFMDHLKHIIEKVSLENLSLTKDCLEEKISSPPTTKWIEETFLHFITKKELAPMLPPQYYEKYISPLLTDTIFTFFRNLREIKCVNSATLYDLPIIKRAKITASEEKYKQIFPLKERVIKEEMDRIKEKIEKKCSKEALKEYEEKGYEHFASLLKNRKRGNEHWILFYLDYFQLAALNLREATQEHEDELQTVGNILIGQMPHEEKAYTKYLQDTLVETMHLSRVLHEDYKKNQDKSADIKIVLNNKIIDTHNKSTDIFNEISDYRNTIRKKVPQKILDEYEDADMYDILPRRHEPPFQ